uniref:Uncharacterized protein n=1 Tax=Glossina pallidipes TaxID=7398 RepID=A0A1B0ABI6_GLOPL
MYEKIKEEEEEERILVEMRVLDCDIPSLTNNAQEAGRDVITILRRTRADAECPKRRMPKTQVEMRVLDCDMRSLTNNAQDAGRDVITILRHTLANKECLKGKLLLSVPTNFERVRNLYIEYYQRHQSN